MHKHQVRNISPVSNNQSTPFGEKLVKNVAAGAAVIVIFALHPLNMASLDYNLTWCAHQFRIFQKY